MAKDLQNPEIILGKNNTVIKSTAFAKKEYEWLLENSMDLIRTARKNKWDKKTIADIHGFFYAAMAGVIRSGVLCSRDTAIDGFPEIHVMIQDTDYHCRENVLYAILEEDAPEIIHPYEDTFASYVENPNLQYIRCPESSQDQGASDEKKKNTSKEEIDALKKEFEEYKTQTALMETKYQKERFFLETELKTAKETKAFFEDQLKNNSDGERLIKMQDQILNMTQEIADSRIMIERTRQEKEEAIQTVHTLETKIQEVKEAKKEEPAEYDYYYKEVLPKLATALGTNGCGLITKLLLFLISGLAIVASMWIVLIA